MIWSCVAEYRKNEPSKFPFGNSEVAQKKRASRLFFVMGFILLRVLEFFVFRKMEMPETKNHLLCGWRQSVVQKNHLSVTIELFRHYCKKGKVILWRIRIMI